MDPLKRALSAITGRTKALTATEVFLKADRRRREGRLAEAASLIATGLQQAPNHTSGHLLAGYVHAASHELEAAKSAFNRVLALEPDHPRAFLGLARVALDEGDFETSRRHLEAALRRYPDFPEATALLDVVASRSTAVGNAPAPAEVPAPEPTANISRVQTLAGTRDVLLARSDGTVLYAKVAGVDDQPLAATLARAVRIATATLARAGLGAPARGIIHLRDRMLVLRSDENGILALALPDSTTPGAALLEANRVWRGAFETGAGASA